ncbi:hypothetical protein AYO49_00705 [Verrucomicrobiaceae bacterium SCGC AG-212-N21]|nr:hypothetical protein AYO49_00705 [Verrucomicrobiaceae bacterium SCGC AG-212-N21]
MTEIHRELDFREHASIDAAIEGRDLLIAAIKEAIVNCDAKSADELLDSYVAIYRKENCCYLQFGSARLESHSYTAEGRLKDIVDDCFGDIWDRRDSPEFDYLADMCAAELAHALNAQHFGLGN